MQQLQKKSRITLLACVGILCASLLLFLTGCNDGDAGVITVKVESVEGNAVVATVGSLEEQEISNEPPEMPDGDGTMSSGQAPDSGSAPPGDEQAPDSGSAPPSDGQVPDSGSASPDEGQLPDNGNTPPAEGQAPSGEIPGDSASGQGQPGGSQVGGGYQFIESSTTVSFTLTEDTKVTVEYQQGSGDGTLDDVVVGSVLEVTLDSDSNATEILVKNLAAGGGFGGSDTVTNGSAANTIETDGIYTDTTYSSTGDDENALRVIGAEVTLEDITVNKESGSSSNTENGDFYGQNAGLLVLDGSTTTISGGTFATSAVNGNAVFSYGEGTTVAISDAKIRTSENNSGGIQTTGGATMKATNLDVETQGASSAAIRTDRGGGTVTVDGGSYVTNGTGSPAIYSTADISVANAQLTANNSEGVVVEGQNSVSLTDCELTGNMQGTYGSNSNQNIQNIMIYQSMSGDAEVGHASFSSNGGSISAKQGDMFYVTNTSCTISLENTELALANDILLNIAGNDGSRGWGTEGANGGEVIFKVSSQKLNGEIIVDAISTLDFSMSSASTFTGCVNKDGSAGIVNVTLDSSSKWILTADSHVSSFDGDLSNIDANGFTLYINGEAAI